MALDPNYNHMTATKTIMAAMECMTKEERDLLPDPEYYKRRFNRHRSMMKSEGRMFSESVINVSGKVIELFSVLIIPIYRVYQSHL